MQRPRQAAVAGGDKAMDEFEPVTYSYAQFYLVFALASMYIAMLMTGWGSGAEAKVRCARCVLPCVGLWECVRTAG